MSHKGADGLEPFQREGQEMFTLFLQPSTGWLDECRRVVSDAKASLATPLDPTLVNDVTIVTTLLDLKRATDAGGDFKRTMDVSVLGRRCAVGRRVL